MNDANQQHALRDIFATQDISQEITNISFDGLRYGGHADIHSGLWTRTWGEPVKVAIKFLRVNHSDSPKVLRRYQREIQVWGRIYHSNILPLVGLCWTTKPLPGMVSPWCEAGDINQYLRSIRDSSEFPYQRNRLVYDVARGLSYLHEYETVIVHGDLKGANILVSAAGIARICDFGLSRMTAELNVTVTNVKGTLRWMAPELLDDNPCLTVESDMWAYACVLIEVFSGRPPYFNKPNDQQVLLALMQKEPPARPEMLPDHLSIIASECFSTNPGQRPTARAVLDGSVVLVSLLEKLAVTDSAEPLTAGAGGASFISGRL